MKNFIFAFALLFAATQTKVNAGQYMTRSCATVLQNIENATNADVALGGAACANDPYCYGFWYSIEYASQMTPNCYSGQ